MLYKKFKKDDDVEMSTKQQINSYNKVKNLIESKNGLLFSKLDDYQNINSIVEYES